MMERLQVGKILINRKPLVIKEVKFAPADDGASRKRIEEVYRLLLAPGKAEKPVEKQERRKSDG